MSDETQLQLEQRRRFINQQLETLKREAATYEAELAELDVAERVYQRLHGARAVVASAWPSSKPAPWPAPPAADSKGDEEEQSEESGMTLPKVVFQVLDKAKAEGRKGVDSSEMLKFIRQEWKPDFKPDQLRPTLWRMVKRKRLRKRGKLYSRPEEAAEPSQGQLDVVRH